MSGKKIISAFALLVVLSLNSCQDDYLERQPFTPSSGTYYSNEDELKLGLLGCYQSMNYKDFNYGLGNLRVPWPVFIDAASDICWDRTNGDLQNIGKGSIDANNRVVLIKYTEAYKGIARCNFLLDNVGKLEGKVPAAVYNQSIAEARFIRAYHYIELVTYFGGVPLITKDLPIEELQVPKSTQAQVVDFILSEMDAALPNLPLNQAVINDGRATKGAALAFKARIALYDARWDVAATAAKAVMDLNNKYALHPNFADLFKYAGESSKEIILSLQYAKNVNTHTAPRYLLPRLPGGVCDKVPFQSFIDSYECTDGLSIDKSPLYDVKKPFLKRDPRLSFTCGIPGDKLFGYQFETHKDSLQIWNYNVMPAVRIANTEATHAFATFTGYVFRKYCDEIDRTNTQDSELNITLIRYAEVLLTYAEAKIELDKIDKTVYDAINLVRQRPTVNMPAITMGKSQPEMRSIVRKERKYELAMEGLRLADIRRWKIAEQVLSGPAYGRIARGLLANPPVVDANGTPHYDNVTNKAEMRVIETKIFNKDRDYLWPFPRIEVLTNKQLVQNPNY